MIVHDEHFNKILETMSKTVEPVEPKVLVLDLRPRSQRDFTYIGINNKIKINNFQVIKIRKFLSKKVLMKLQICEEYTKDLLNPDSNRLQIKI